MSRLNRSEAMAKMLAGKTVYNVEKGIHYLDAYKFRWSGIDHWLEVSTLYHDKWSITIAYDNFAMFDLYEVLDG